MNQFLPGRKERGPRLKPTRFDRYKHDGMDGTMDGMMDGTMDRMDKDDGMDGT